MNEDIKIKYHRICEKVTDAKKKTKSDIKENCRRCYFVLSVQESPAN